MNWVIELRLLQLVGEECNGLQTVSLILAECSSDRESGCISGDNIRKRFVRENEDGSRRDSGFQSIK